MTEMIPFAFNDQLVRVVRIDDEPWFVLADVCRVLEHSNPTMAASRLDEDEKHTLNNAEGIANAQVQQITIISESGLYALVMTSRKPQARRFRKWVTAEVLPGIRKTGHYTAPGAFSFATIDPKTVMATCRMLETTRKVAGKAAALALWHQLGLPVKSAPGGGWAPTWPGRDYDDPAIAEILAELRRPGVKPVAEALAYQQLRDRDWSTADIAAAIAKTQRYVQLRLILLDGVAPEVLEAVNDGGISLAAARALKRVPPLHQRALIDRIVARQPGWRTAHEITLSLAAAFQIPDQEVGR